MRTMSKFFQRCLALAAALLLQQMIDQSALARGGCTPSTGPDVIVGDLIGFNKYGTVGDISGYTFGTVSCNIGDQILQWIAADNRHPVIAMNAFRLKNGRFEQIGMSWLKHGWGASAENLCCTCINPNNFQALGIGCSDPYDAGTNGIQGGFMWEGNLVAGLGPRSDVNAATGSFPWPYSTQGLTGNAIYKRLQIHLDDLDPAQNAGALYFAEGHYITPNDAQFNNDNNNASYRRFTVGSFTSGSYTLAFTGTTQRQKPALQAWKDNDSAVTLLTIDVPSDGRFILGYKHSNNGNGTWHYEFALHNINSHRSGRNFVVPIPAGANVTNIQFHDVDYHSGEIYDLTDWQTSLNGGALFWSMPIPGAGQEGNALRWGTLYNYSFDADLPPGPAMLGLGLFRTGFPDAVGAFASGPVKLGDTDGSGTVDINDLLNVINAWGACPAPPATCFADVAPAGGNGQVDIDDLLMIINHWG